MIFLGAIVSAIWMKFGPYYATLVSGLLGTLGLYLGANITSRLMTTQQMNVVSKIPGAPVLTETTREETVDGTKGEMKESTKEEVKGQ